MVRRLRGLARGARGCALMAGFTQETATARLSRLLTMVPWLVNRQGIDLQQAADDLGVSVEQLEADLNLLFLCGYGQMPDELIEADWEEGRVFVGNADTIARPLRLGVDEARDPRRGPAGAARGAGAGRPRRRRPGPGQARGCRRRGRRSGPPGAGGGRRRRLARAAGPRRSRRSPTTGGCTCATSCPAATRPPSATSTRCGSSAWTAAGTSRAGATAPRTPGCSASTASRSSPCSTSTAPRRRSARERDLSEGTFRPAPDDLVVTLRLLPGGHLGGRLLPGGVGGARAGRRRRRPAGADAHRRHRVAAPAGHVPARPTVGLASSVGRERGSKIASRPSSTASAIDGRAATATADRTSG